MFLKTSNAVITVVAGVGVAVAVYWILNKIAELLPGRWEDRIKPYLYILPAYAAITLYLIYPVDPDLQVLLQGLDQHRVGGLRQLHQAAQLT